MAGYRIARRGIIAGMSSNDSIHRSSVSGSINGDWVRTLAAPMQRARAWCLLLAAGLLVLAAGKLRGSHIGAALSALLHGGAAQARAALAPTALLDGLVALAGALSAWFLFRAASALSAAYRSAAPADARAGFAQLARYFVMSAITSALGLLLLLLGVAGAFTQVLHGVSASGL